MMTVGNRRWEWWLGKGDSLMPYVHRRHLQGSPGGQLGLRLADGRYRFLRADKR